MTRTNYIIVTAQAAALRITDIKIIGANVLITFTSEPGKSYRLEYTDGLGTPWLTAADFGPAPGNVFQVTHLGGAGRTSRFYRIKALP